MPRYPERPVIQVIKDLVLPTDDEHLSEGEEIVRDFLQDERIKFRREAEIHGLQGDCKSHRRADFFLPSYGVYVEFMGLWNQSKEERERYREKMRVYARNNLPCVYLFPENLGTLDHSFHRRLTEVLLRHGKKRELLRYNFKCWRSDHQTEVFVSGLLGMLLITLDNGASRWVCAASMLFAMFYLWRQWLYYSAKRSTR